MFSNKRLILAAVFAAVTWAVPAPAQTPADAAQTETVDFDISAQSLSAALVEFGQQSGQELLYSGEAVAGKSGNAVHGSMTRRDAMALLLEGTGLEFDMTPSGGMIVGDRATLDARRAEWEASAAGQNTIGQRRPGIEEIIVTGQKREERIQDVPIAISAFTAEDLEAQKIEGGFDLLKGVPNVTFSKTNFSGYNFQIRGIGTQAISATTDPGVAVSFNNTTLIVNRLFEQEYLDVERVEVLRGPQGTLFGRNATAGVINVITNKPEMGVWDGMIDVEVGNFNTRRLRGFVNAPIGDTLAIRGAYASTVRDGYGHNEFSAESKNDPFRDPVQADVDDRDLWTGRLTLGWQPNDRLRVNLLWERFEEDDRRVRTSKQLCTRDTGEGFFNSSGDPIDASAYRNAALSQGCKAGSLYADEAFGTPNGASLPFLSGIFWGSEFAGTPAIGTLAGASGVFGLGGSPYFTIPEIPGSPGTPDGPPCIFPPFFPPGCGPGDPPSDPVPAVPGPLADQAQCSARANKRFLMPVDICNSDVFRNQQQSRDLRTISSQLEPQYKAEADIFELAFDFELSDELLLSSQTVYVEDEFYATQDYNRFTAFPIWEDSSSACFIASGGFSSSAPGDPDCSPEAIGTYANGFYADVSPRPEGSPLGTPGVVCDPQLGCSDTLLMQDLSRARSKQFNQEIRLVSSFGGDVNFSLGANYTNFETVNDYFVFANALTHILNFFPFQYHNSQCVTTSSPESIESRQFDGDFCRFVDPNSLDDIIAGQGGDGHNYFRSGNPYKLRSSAIFGELYWNATETVKFTAGLRLTWDRKVFTPLPSQLLLGDFRDIVDGGPERCVDRRTTCVLAGTAPDGRGFVSEPDIVQEWREPTGRLVVDWSPAPVFDWQDETMIYASFSRGYKGGGANPPSVARPAGDLLVRASGGFRAPPTFEPEFVNAYELGTKNTLFSGALVLNGSAFYYDYTDYQISKILDRSAFNENFDAEVWGLELETIFAPSLNWQFNAAIGYLRTEVAEGEESIDLMDRTDGGNRHFAADPNALGETGRTTDFPDGFDEWVVIQPWITSASNCVVPRELIEANFLTSTRNFLNAFCPTGNVAGTSTSSLEVAHFTFDEDGNRTGVVEPTGSGVNFDPSKDAPNGGQGFFKDLGGNELPNAPKFTVALGGQYGFDLTRDWRATARVDYYWQDESFARIYNMPDFDRLKSWSNTNLSFWVNNPVNGITLEAYVKNVFDETPITGTFLNSDDSGLTTNVFTLDPRLIGVSVRKEF